MGKHPEYVNGGTNIRLRVDRRGNYLPRSKESQRIGAPIGVEPARQITSCRPTSGARTARTATGSRPRSCWSPAAGYNSWTSRTVTVPRQRMAIPFLSPKPPRWSMTARSPSRRVFSPPPPTPQGRFPPSWRGTGLSLCSPLRVQEKPPYRERWANAPQTFFCTALWNAAFPQS